MKLKLLKENKDGLIRVESSGAVKEVLIKEDFLHPNEESVSVCFRGANSSGIVDFTPKEIETLYAAVKNRMHLIKSVKRL